MQTKKIRLNSKIFLFLVIILPLVFNAILFIFIYKASLIQNNLAKKQFEAIARNQINNRLNSIDLSVKLLIQNEIIKDYISLSENQKFLIENRVFSLLRTHSMNNEYISSISINNEVPTKMVDTYSFKYPIEFNDQGINIINNSNKNQLITTIDLKKISSDIKYINNFQVHRDSSNKWITRIEIIKNIDFELWIYFILTIFLSLACTFTGIYLFRHNVITPLNSLYSSIAEKLNFSETNKLDNNEIENLEHAFEQYNNDIINAQKKLLSQQEKITFINTAKQVAHDIRSPLAALKMALVDTGKLADNTRQILRNSISRIEDISNDLLERSRSETRSTVDKVHVLSVLSEIITQKRLEYKSFANIELTFDSNINTYSCFSNINRTDLSRVLSNIINNSYEAISEKGIVTVNVKLVKSVINIVVKDNGHGIRPEDLKRLGNEEFTKGKTQGNGLGFFKAKEIITKVNGNIKVKSKTEIGTEVTISLPSLMPPPWFAVRVLIKNKIVILDDDQGMQQTWEKRLYDSDLNYNDLKIYSSATKLLREINDLQDYTFLLDYEILNEDKNGLDIIKKIKAKENTYLVTSYYEEADLQEQIVKLESKIVPKPLSSIVPIKQKIAIKYIILIDDDKLIRSSWLKRYQKHNFHIKAYRCIEDFLKDSNNISREAYIFVDSNLENGIKGEVESEKIFKMGFKKIYLSTGYEVNTIEKPAWIIQVISKDYNIINILE